MPALPLSSPAVPLAPGFRFHPTDEELVAYYLRRRVLGRRLRVDAIAEVDLYRVEPWDLPSRSRLRSKDREWYFFSPLDRKQASRSRTNRATDSGYWKTTGKDREVRHRGSLVGMKKTLVFHSGRAPKGVRTNWVMHEYRLVDADVDTPAALPKDSFVVCRIFLKNGSGPMNGAQYGAPFEDEEWEEVESEEVECGAQSMNEMMQDDDTNEADDCVQNKERPMAQTSSDLNDDSCLDGREEDHKEPTFNHSLDNVDHSGEQNHVKKDIDAAVSNPTETIPIMEYGDMYAAYAANWGVTSNDSVPWQIRGNSHEKSISSSDWDKNMEDLFNLAEFFDGDNKEDVRTETSDNVPLFDRTETSDNVPLLENPLIEGADRDIFYDAASYLLVDRKDEYSPPFDYFYSHIPGSSNIDPEDDLLVYFNDDNDSHIEHKIPASATKAEDQELSANNVSVMTHKVDDNKSDLLAKASDANKLSGASSSGWLSDDASQFLHHGVLGKLPAAPGMAAECSHSFGKSVGSAAQLNSGHPLTIRTGILQIDGATFSTSYWSMQKHRDDLHFTVSHQLTHFWRQKLPGADHPIVRMQSDTLASLLLASLYLFFISAACLAMTCKVRQFIYGW